MGGHEFSEGKMHDDEVDTDASLVGRLLAAQFPDLLSGTLLAVRGRLSAVIDFGCLGVGDPACDVMAAWMFLSPETRGVFRAALQVDDATWARGRGWALSVGLIALPYYQSTNPELAGIARRAIRAAVADYRH